MSLTKHVEFGEAFFWARDDSLGVLIKHMIDLAVPLSSQPSHAWLIPVLDRWRRVAVVSPCGWGFDPAMSANQIQVISGLLREACGVLSRRDVIPNAEIASWEILDDLRICLRTSDPLPTACVVELAEAVIALLENRLPPPPPGKRHWYHGFPEGVFAG